MIDWPRTSWICFDIQLELLEDSSSRISWGPTLGTWKATVHLCVLGINPLALYLELLEAHPWVAR